MLVGKFAEALNLTLQSYSETSSRFSSASFGKERHEEEKLTFFDSSVVPPVSIEAYVRRLHKHFLCGDQCFVVALVYIDRLLRPGTKVGPLSPRNTHRIVLTSLLIATKFLEDAFYSNSYYSKCGGVTLKEMNKLERYFLRKVNFNLFVSALEYRTYETALLRLGAQEDSETAAAQTDATQEDSGPASSPTEPAVAVRKKSAGYNNHSFNSGAKIRAAATTPPRTGAITVAAYSKWVSPSDRAGVGNNNNPWLGPSDILGINLATLGSRSPSSDKYCRKPEGKIPDTPSTCSGGPSTEYDAAGSQLTSPQWD